MSDTTTTVWTEADIKDIESQIGQNLANAATLLILGVEAKFYKITGDRTSVAWVKRVTAGSGFTFSRKSVSGELSARDAMIVAMIKDNRTIQDIANALDISVGTVHAVKKSQSLDTVGGSKRGAGRQSDESDKTGETTEPTAEADESDNTRKPTDPINTALNAIDRVKTFNKDDSDGALDDWALIIAHIVEVSGVDAATLAERGAKIIALGDK